MENYSISTQQSKLRNELDSDSSEGTDDDVADKEKLSTRRNEGGLKTMPFIIGN